MAGVPKGEERAVGRKFSKGWGGFTWAERQKSGGGGDEKGNHRTCA